MLHHWFHRGLANLLCLSAFRQLAFYFQIIIILTSYFRSILKCIQAIMKSCHVLSIIQCVEHIVANKTNQSSYPHGTVRDKQLTNTALKPAQWQIRLVLWLQHQQPNRSGFVSPILHFWTSSLLFCLGR